MSAALDDAPDAPRLVAEVLVWLAWAVGLLAVAAPRPSLLTVVRIVAPAFVLLSLWAALEGSASASAATAALGATCIALALVSTHDLALAAANAGAYGDEERVLLRTPPALFLGPLPIARVTAAAAVAAPPLLLADERWAFGAVALALGVAAVIVLGRALHGLSRRWGVLVPAGFVIVDPLTLADPVLFLRERIVSMRAADAAPAPPEVTDLRLGAAAGSVALAFDEPAELGRRTRGKTASETLPVTELRFAVARREAFLSAAAARRIPVR